VSLNSVGSESFFKQPTIAVSASAANVMNDRANDLRVMGFSFIFVPCLYCEVVRELSSQSLKFEAVK
jgi:hypothetical protein